MPGKSLLFALFLVLAAPPAGASTIPLVEAVGGAQDLGIGGNWARSHAVVDADGEPGWMLTWGAGGDLWAGSLVQHGEAWSVDAATARRLTDDGRLVDHAIEQCPDGTWLHVASLNLDAPDDSAWSFVYDEDLRLLHSGPVEERRPERAHNDMALICGEGFRGVTFPDYGARQTWFVPLDETGAPGEAVELLDAPAMTGGSLVEDPATGWLTAYGTEELVRLAVAQYDADLALVRYNPVVVPHGTIGWWPQGLVAVGEGWLVAYLSVPEDDPGRDLDLGDVWLATLQGQLFLRLGHEVQGWDPPEGAGRPGLAVRDGLALVTYDHDNRLWLHAAQVDPTGDSGPDGDGGAEDGGAEDGGAADGGADDGTAADGGAAEGGAEDGGAGSGDSTDGDDVVDASDGKSAGCSGAGAAAALVLLWPAVFALVGRSRR